MTRTGTTSETIAEFAAGFDRARTSAATVRQCGRALADTLAVGIAGLREPSVGRALRYVEDSTLRLDGGNSRPAYARLWGTGRTAPIETAGLFNGIAAHVLDFDDASSPMSGHPSVALLPALVALAEARDIEGLRLASAYAVGFEICCKVGRALDLTHYARGWHMTSSVGTIAAAAACGHLLGMSAAPIVNAIGLAVAQTGGTRENFGTDAKSFQAGQCNAAALRAVLLAEQGFTAAPTALDGKAGYTALYSKGEDISAALRCLPSDPLEIESSGVEVKKYPACYGIHRPLDGLFELRQKHSLTMDDIEQIKVETSYGALAPLILHMPRSGTEGKFSMQYTLAAAIADGEIRLASFTDEAVARPALRGLMGRISAREVSDQMVPRWALITVQLKSGEVLRRRIGELRGSARSPLSDVELLAKIMDCVSWSGRPIDPTSLFQAAMQLGTHRVRDILMAVERPKNATSKAS
jgi:2-methylcitrate dehydratase PrpD